MGKIMTGAFVLHLATTRNNLTVYHFVKVSVLGVFWSVFWSAFGLNTKTCFIINLIQSECGKMQTRKALNTDPSYAVYLK